jgi:hypothetical protein
MAQNDLLAMVRDKQAQIAKLQAELEEVRQLLAGELPIQHPPPVPRGITRGVGRGRGRRKRRQSSVTWAAEAVNDNGGPLHVDQMIERISQKHGRQIDKQTLVSNLARLVKAKQGWQRTGPNTFGLTGGK